MILDYGSIRDILIILLNGWYGGLIIASIPSYISLFDSEALWLWIMIGIALLYTSRIMYVTLVYLTGAIPSEYYSAQKRPAYKAYQQSTNIFFPGPKKV